MDETERRIEQEALEALHPHLGEGERAKAPVSRDPAERRIEQEALSVLEKHEGKGSPREDQTRVGEHFHSPWSAGHEVMNHLTQGSLTRGTLGQIERDIWQREHPMETFAAQEVVPIAMSALGATALGRGARALGEIGEMAGLRGSEDVAGMLTGRSSRLIEGITNPLLRGMAKIAAPTIPGAWQGALSASMYPQEGESQGASAARGALEGGVLGPVTNMLHAPTTANVAKGTASLAQRYLAAGGDLNTAQIPGSPLAARAVARFIKLHRADPQRLTAKAIESMGGQGTWLDGKTARDAIDAANTKIENLTTNMPNFADLKLAQEMNAEHRRVTANFKGANDFKRLDDFHKKLADHIANGTLTGSTYRNITGQGTIVSKLLKDKDNYTYGQTVQKALEDAMERNSPSVASELRLAQNQRHNAYTLQDLGDERTGLLDPNKAYARIQTQYKNKGGTSALSAENARAGNPVDLGTLIEGGKQFPLQPGVALGPLAGHGLSTGAGVLGADLLAEHGDLASLAPHAPWLGGAAAGLTLLNALRGVSQLTPGFRDRMISNALRGGAPFRGSVAIPALTTWPPDTRKGASSALPLGSGRDLIVQEANAQGVDPALALAMAHQESGIEHRDARGRIQISPAGAIGITQLMPGTAEEMGVDPYDEAQNARGGVGYLKKMLDRYNGNRTLALAAYNAGPERVDSYVRGRSGLPAETQNYVRSIQGSLPPATSITVNPRPGYWSSAQPLSANANPNLLTAPAQPQAQGDNNGPM